MHDLFVKIPDYLVKYIKNKIDFKTIILIRKEVIIIVNHSKNPILKNIRDILMFAWNLGLKIYDGYIHDKKDSLIGKYQ